MFVLLAKTAILWCFQNTGLEVLMQKGAWAQLHRVEQFFKLWSHSCYLHRLRAVGTISGLIVPFTGPQSYWYDRPFISAVSLYRTYGLVGVVRMLGIAALQLIMAENLTSHIQQIDSVYSCQYHCMTCMDGICAIRRSAICALATTLMLDSHLECMSHCMKIDTLQVSWSLSVSKVHDW